MANDKRIAVASLALSAAGSARGDNPEYGEEAIIDLLTDLRHYCHHESIDFARCALLAEIHFEEEHK